MNPAALFTCWNVVELPALDQANIFSDELQSVFKNPTSNRCSKYFYQESMKNKQSIQRIEILLKSAFGNKLLAIYLFGSWGSDFETIESDIDIAVLCSDKFAPGSLWSTAQEIAATLKRDVDLLDLRSASTVMQLQIITSGERVHYIDFECCERFEDFVFSSYARLNEERREIIKDIQVRGSIYG